jgi:ABC-2 type transport system permease protein
VTSASLHSRPEGFVSGSSKPTLIARTKRVWTYRRILQLLVARDLKVRYAGSALGYVWTVLEPLLMSLIYWFVFTKIFHRNAGPNFSPFMLYLVSGQLAWAWFAGGVNGVTRALRSEAQMVRSSNVPRELWVLRVVASKAVEYFFSLPVLAIFAIVYLVAPTKYIFLLPLGWLLQATLITGIGLILAPVTVLVRDLERIVPIFMRVMFYGSPVLYSISQVPDTIREVFSVNPTVGFLTISHAIFFPAAIQEPRQHVVHDSSGNPVYHLVTVRGHEVRAKLTHTVYVSHWNWIWHSALSTVIIFAIGVWVFTRLERSALKEI